MYVGLARVGLAREAQHYLPSLNKLKFIYAINQTPLEVLLAKLL